MGKVQLNFDCRFWLLFQSRHVFSRRPVRWGKAETFLANEGVSVTFGRGMRKKKRQIKKWTLLHSESSLRLGVSFNMLGYMNAFEFVIILLVVAMYLSRLDDSRYLPWQLRQLAHIRSPPRPAWQMLTDAAGRWEVPTKRNRSTGQPSPLHPAYGC